MAAWAAASAAFSQQRLQMVVGAANTLSCTRERNMSSNKRLRGTALTASCLATIGLLAGCGGGGLFSESEIQSVTITPATVAAPAAGTPSRFNVAVAIKNRSSSTVMVTLSVRRTDDSGWERIGTATCADNQPCETEPVVLECFSMLPTGDSARRDVDCIGTDAPVQRHPGTMKMRLELRDYDIFTGLSSNLDDSAEREITLQ